jgi:hypothetical protein
MRWEEEYQELFGVTLGAGSEVLELQAQRDTSLATSI